MAIAFALAGCGSRGPSGTSSLSAFKSSFSADKPQLRSVAVALDAAIAQVAGKPGAQSATQLSALASRAQQQASALEALNPPTRFNTELRALGSALEVTAADLGQISAGASQHNARASRSAVEALRTDAANVHSTETRVSQSLGLPPG